MVITLFLFDLSLHLFILLLLYSYIVFLDLSDYLLPQLLLLYDIFLIELDKRGLIDIESLHLIHCELVINIF